MRGSSARPAILARVAGFPNPVTQMSDFPHSLTSRRPATVWLALAVLGTGCSNQLEPPPSNPSPPDPVSAAELAFTSDPAPAYAGQILQPFGVRASLPSGQTDAGFTGTITLRLEGTGTLVGATVVRAIEGVAVFSGLRIMEPGNDYRLRADAVGLRGARSGSFAIHSDLEPGAHGGYRLVFGSCRTWSWNGTCASGGLTVVHQDGFERELSPTRDVGMPQDPAWSPDETRIAFSGYSHCESADDPMCAASIYLVNADGSRRVRLEFLGSAYGYASYGPAWSPDGRLIAFETRNGPHGTARLYVMNSDGSDPRRLGDLEGSDPAWSPDGTRIAFSTVVSGRSSIAVALADGTQPVLLTTPASLAGDPANDWRPAWSPDGTRIAFTRSWTYPDGDGSCQVLVMKADGSAPVQLTHDSFCSQSPAWLPDGATIGFNGSADGFQRGIMLMDADGSNQRLIRRVDTDFSRVAWAPRR